MERKIVFKDFDRLVDILDDIQIDMQINCDQLCNIGLCDGCYKYGLCSNFNLLIMKVYDLKKAYRQFLYDEERYE